MKIVFCLPGNNYSGKFLECWTELIYTLDKNGIEYGISRKESSVIYYVRNMCLGGNVLRGENQLPFNGKLDYDYLMWIDSDIIFKPEHFYKLLSYNEDIVSGLYKMSDGQSYATVKTWDTNYFINNGVFQFIKDEDIKQIDLNDKKLLNVAYTGFGFILIKKGVFESLKYPWFRPIDQTIGSAVDFTSEDVSFCLRTVDKGYKIYVDPSIIVGHEKRVIL